MLYKQGTRLLYLDSLVKFTLTSKGLFSFARLLTDHAKFCGRDIFDAPILSTGVIKKFLGHYGEITLSDINTQAEIINNDNGNRDK